MTKKHFLFSAALLLAASSAFAQGNGLSGINEATSMVTSYFDPADEVDIRHRRGRGSDRRREGLWQVLVGRPRHQQDRRLVVRRVYFPDRGGDHPAFVLPLIVGRWQNTL